MFPQINFLDFVLCTMIRRIAPSYNAITGRSLNDYSFGKNHEIKITHPESYIKFPDFTPTTNEKKKSRNNVMLIKPRSQPLKSNQKLGAISKRRRRDDAKQTNSFFFFSIHVCRILGYKLRVTKCLTLGCVSRKLPTS